MNSIRRAKISKLVIIIKTWLIEVKEDDMVVYLESYFKY
jgi:hypothetical protein